MRVAALSGIEDPPGTGLLGTVAGSGQILVAGGLGSPRALDALRQVAPVVAVVGHQDFLALGDGYPETADVRIAGARVVVTPLAGSWPDLVPSLRQLLEHDPPDVVVHGQGAHADVRWLGGTLFVCPGPARGPRPGRHGTCALLDIDGPGRITAHIVEIP